MTPDPMTPDLDALRRLADKMGRVAAGPVPGGGGGVDGDDLRAWQRQAPAAVLAFLDRLTLAADWRATLNAVCNLCGHPPISPDEGHTASIADAVAARMRELDRLQEAEEGGRLDGLAQYAASLDHHEEHHRREEELESRLRQAEADRDAAREALGRTVTALQMYVNRDGFMGGGTVGWVSTAPTGAHEAIAPTRVAPADAP